MASLFNSDPITLLTPPQALLPPPQKLYSRLLPEPLVDTKLQNVYGPTESLFDSVSKEELTLFVEQPFLFQDGCLEADVTTGTSVRADCERQLGGTAGHQSLHAGGKESCHALALIKPQFASRVLHTLPFLKQNRKWFQT